MPLSVQTRVPVTLYYLVDKGHMRKVANASGIGKSAVSPQLFLDCLVHSTLNIRRQ